MSSQQPGQDPKPNSRRPIRVTHASGEVYEPRTTPILVKAFQNDPVMRYFMNGLSGAKRLEALKNLIRLMLVTAMMNNAVFYEAGTLEDDEISNKDSAEPKFQCAAAVVPPGKAITDLGPRAWWKLLKEGVFRLIWSVGIGGLSRLLHEYGNLSEQSKKKILLKDEAYYYLLIIGTSEEHRGKGLCPAIIKESQIIAQKKNIPIWLEASTKQNVGIYEKVGFERVGETIVLGKGKCNIDGEEAKGDEAVGVEVYPMVWWPNGYVRDTKLRN